jgi:hypothetical protein
VGPTTVAASRRYSPDPERFLDLGDGRVGDVEGGKRVVLGDGRMTIVDPESVPGLSYPIPIPDALGGGWFFTGIERDDSASFSPMSLAIDAGLSPAMPRSCTGLVGEEAKPSSRIRRPKWECEAAPRAFPPS